MKWSRGKESRPQLEKAVSQVAPTGCCIQAAPRGCCVAVYSKIKTFHIGEKPIKTQNVRKQVRQQGRSKGR